MKIKSFNIKVFMGISSFGFRGTVVLKDGIGGLVEMFGCWFL